MHEPDHAGNVPGKRRLQQSRTRSLLLITALGCSAALAGTGHVPTDQDTYPQPITAIPAVVSQCFACHGPNGRSEYEDWPSLAGQKQAYLIQQLRDFKSGARNHPMMQPVVAVLSDDDLKTAADYLSAQPPPQPDTTGTTPDAPAAAAACIVCHDNPALPTEPYLHAQQPAYLAAQIRAFQTGERQSEIMQPMVKGLTDTEISELARYFSAQAPVSPAAK